MQAKPAEKPEKVVEKVVEKSPKKAEKPAPPPPAEESPKEAANGAKKGRGRPAKNVVPAAEKKETKAAAPKRAAPGKGIILIAP